jgi:hypothetical protein
MEDIDEGGRSHLWGESDVGDPFRGEPGAG